MNTGYLVVAVLYLLLALTKSGVGSGTVSLKAEVLIYGAIAVAYVVMSANE